MNEATQDMIAAVERCLRNFSYTFTSETDLHEKIGTVLKAEGLEYDREVIAGKGRYDFFLPGGIVIEVKVDGSLAAALRQADRYCKQPEVNFVLIAATCHWASIERRYELQEKPVRVVKIRRTFM